MSRPFQIRDKVRRIHSEHDELWTRRGGNFTSIYTVRQLHPYGLSFFELESDINEYI